MLNIDKNVICDKYIMLEYLYSITSKISYLTHISNINILILLNVPLNHFIIYYYSYNFI